MSLSSKHASGEMGYELGYSSIFRGKKGTFRHINLRPVWRRLEGDLHLSATLFSSVLDPFLTTVDIRGRWVKRLLQGGEKS